METVAMVATKAMAQATNMINKSMVNKAVLILVITMATMFQETAYAVPTKWEAIQLSMSELIKNGWQITAHSISRVAANSSTTNSFDERQFSFVLTKNGNYIICIADNPKPPVANNTDCRKLS
jgi:hypothetical protein